MRIFEIESVIRDSKQVSLEIQYPQFSKDIQKESVVKLTFEKFEKELIELVLFNPSEVDLLDDRFGGEYISHIKAFQTDDGIEISFDPYDERIDKIEDRDNYVFKSYSYEITSKPI